MSKQRAREIVPVLPPAPVTRTMLGAIGFEARTANPALLKRFVVVSEEENTLRLLVLLPKKYTVDCEAQPLLLIGK